MSQSEVVSGSQEGGERESVKDSTFLLASVVGEREGERGARSATTFMTGAARLRRKKKRESFDILVACIVENSYNSRYKW